MEAHWLDIESRRRSFVGDLAGIGDFAVRDAGPADPQVALRDPAVSLYAVDVVGAQAVFTRLPPGHDLTAAPFVYQAQYDLAERLLVVPFDALIALAATLPDPANPIVVYSTGRAGSTLLSRALNAIGTVASLSEPDAISQFAELPRDAWRSAADMRTLLVACLRFCAWPHRTRATAGMAFKLRAQGVGALDLVAAAMPQAHALFLYRNAVDYVASMTRLSRRIGLAETQPRGEGLAVLERIFAGHLPDPDRLLERSDRTELSRVAFWALHWLATIELYLEQYAGQLAAGREVLAVPYEALDRRRRQVLPVILAHCGLPPAAAEAGLRGFHGDAQAGTSLARERPDEESYRLTSDEVATVEAMVRRHPEIARTDPVLPGTPAVARA